MKEYQKTIDNRPINDDIQNQTHDIMKSSNIIFLFILFSCNQEMNDETNYLQEYRKYAPTVASKTSAIEPSIADSANAILDEYLLKTAIFSCTWYIAEGPVFEPVNGFVKRHPKSLVIVLDRALQGIRLTWGFRVLFKEFYPDEYQKLLKEANIQLTPEDQVLTEEDRWQNQLKEYDLPFDKLAGDYLARIK